MRCYIPEINRKRIAQNEHAGAERITSKTYTKTVSLK